MSNEQNLCSENISNPVYVTLGMGPRYVISVTKNEARNEAGCYQNRIASHFNRSARTARRRQLQSRKFKIHLKPF